MVYLHCCREENRTIYVSFWPVYDGYTTKSGIQLRMNTTKSGIQLRMEYNQEWNTTFIRSPEPSHASVCCRPSPLSDLFWIVDRDIADAFVSSRRVAATKDHISAEKATLGKYIYIFSPPLWASCFLHVVLLRRRWQLAAGYHHRGGGEHSRQSAIWTHSWTFFSLGVMIKKMSSFLTCAAVAFPLDCACYVSRRRRPYHDVVYT